jgi:glycerol-3-phosphate cytidylyltransferase
MKIIITFGTFDLFHYGHVQILKRARELGDKLIVGVSTDEFNIKKKGIAPVFSYEHRKSIIESLKYVDEVFPEESMEEKRNYIEKYNADVLVMGDDWVGAFDGLASTVVYFERTPTISTTYYKNIINVNTSKDD